ncbi:hypothetical protein [Microscilla marina]|uniref:Uncharacterized protein n=1 Tax=Microscilla marina ATCC 23134 TaxID=313606 RepID=A1ZP17_MICM2|nr:hypothetical protein [Microscilla marina]EAY27809.1 hypothetical protein M23134_00250 [Microscilla marina ATCC 23134]
MFSFGFFVMFYAMTNLVPAEVQKFKMSWQTSGDRVLEMHFEKEDKRWKISDGKSTDDNVYLSLKDAHTLLVDIQSEQKFPLDLKKFLKKEPNKNWKNLNYFYVMDDEAGKTQLKVHRGKKLIRITKANEGSEDFDKNFIRIRVTWK